SSARTLLSDPLPARPMGVRMASTITASGMRFLPWSWPSRERARISAYVLVAPERDEVAIQTLAEGDDLRLEASTQLQHQPLVRRSLRSIRDPPKRRGDRVAAERLRRDRVHRANESAALGGVQTGPADRRSQLVKAHRAN